MSNKIFELQVMPFLYMIKVKSKKSRDESRANGRRKSIFSRGDPEDLRQPGN
jgi:hypothetical protein